MANSYIKLYYGTEQQKWLLQPQKLMVIEDIEEYLNNFSFIDIENYQYVKNDIALTLKFDLSQRYTNPLIEDGIKYVRVLNSDSATPIYYYVDNAEWRGKECVRLTLSMDILNTFKYDIDYKLSDKTKITRQHKDRLQQDGIGLNYLRVIDKQAENINPNLYKFEEHKINDDGRKWYLIYKSENTNENAPVQCYVLANENINFKINNLTNAKLSAQDLEEGKFYYIELSLLSSGFKIKLQNGEQLPRAIDPQAYKRVTLTRSGANINVMYQGGANASDIKLINSYSVNFIELLQSPTYGAVNNAYVEPISGNSISWIYTSQTQVTLSKINDLDRTNPLLIKVVELPYMPFNFDGELVPQDFEAINLSQPNGTDILVFKLKNNNAVFNHTFSTFGETPLKPLSITAPNLNPLSARNDIIESKIYNSEFYNAKFVYDSFVFNFELEKVDLDEFKNIVGAKQTAHIQYNVANTISGKFMFKFTDYVTGTYTLQDYNNILLVARNNEIVLYNNAYLNWVRNGYNYDIKQKNRTQQNAMVGTILGAIGTIGAFASSIYTGGFGIAMGVSMATTTASQIYNLVQTTKASEEALQQKQDQLLQQSTSVSGGDDIDLLNVYTDGNKAKWCYYRPSQQMMNLLYDLFYYCGYADNRQETPIINTRCWFNFIACDIVLDYNKNMTNGMVEQLKTMYANGVTFMHHYNNTWDIEQIKNNVETNLIRG